MEPVLKSFINVVKLKNKSSLYYTRNTTPERVASGKVLLRGLGPGPDLRIGYAD